MCLDVDLIKHNLLVKMDKDIWYLDRLHRKASIETKRELELAVITLKKARWTITQIR